MTSETLKYGLGIVNDLFVEQNLVVAETNTTGAIVSETETTIDSALHATGPIPEMITVADALPAHHITVESGEVTLSFSSTNTAVAKVLIDIPANTTVNITETWQQTTPIAAVILLRVGDNAVVTYTIDPHAAAGPMLAHRESCLSEHASCTMIDLMAHTSYKGTITQHLQGKGAKAQTEYRQLIKDKSIIDLDHAMYHEADQTTSTIIGKPVVTDNAKLIYQANITMPTGYQAMKGDQAADILSLTPTAVVQAVPHLHIAEHTVQCRHGVSISKPQEDHVFYLQSRGVSRADAMAMIIDGHLAS